MQLRARSVPGAFRQPITSFFHALAILFNDASFIYTGRRLAQRTPPVTLRAST